MGDLLVPLYNLPEKACCTGFTLRRPMAFESDTVRNWIRENLSGGWAAEVLPALTRTPSTMIVAIEESSGELAGFCAWDCTALGFFGPVGVAEIFRGKGVGKSLSLKVLSCMREQGYGYGIIGSAGPTDFFRSICNASVITNSTPGIYPEALK